TGLYVPENIDKTYEKVIEKAETTLKHHHSVVLDATFVYQKHRQLAEDLTQTLNIPLINIHCTCPPEIVKQRLTKRQTEKTVSDGRWEIYQQQRTTMDPFTKTSTYLEFDSNNDSYTYRMKKFNDLINLINQSG
ncbi:MAG: AAA family ATPase, partial [Candidatus Thermoplasmatota archaeon]|nr:AAA family ATPase [Candidatus Thermoplasmatota archaeon]